LPGKQIQDPDNKKAGTPRTTPRVVPARQATPQRGATPPPSSASGGVNSRLGANNRGLPLAKQVEQLKARRDAMQAELEEEEAAAIDAEAEAIEAENAAMAGEQQMTSEAAEVLAEVAAKLASTDALEAELTDVTAKLQAERSQNLQLCARNCELDRESSVLQQAVAEGKAELKRISQSQVDLDAALERHAKKSEDLKVAAGVQRDRCAADWTRLNVMTKRLIEVSGENPSEEVNRLLVEGAERMRKVEDARIFCQNLHEQGPQPQLAPVEASEEAAPTQAAEEAGPPQGEGPEPQLLATCEAATEDAPLQAAACGAAE